MKPNHLYSLAGMKALVTGARRNIGRGIALALAEAGCDVGINDIERDDDADQTLALLRERGREACFLAADVSDSAAVERMFAVFTDRFGPIDILVNNAYAGVRQPFPAIDESEWDRTLDVSLKGAFLCARAAARDMLATGRTGSIVNIGSVHGDRAWPGGTCYGVAKAGLQRLTASIALDLGEHGIRCNAVLPGTMDLEHRFGTPPPAVGSIRPALAASLPLRRRTTPEDIGHAVVFLCSPAAGCITGVALPVDGGLLISAAGAA